MGTTRVNETRLEVTPLRDRARDRARASTGGRHLLPVRIKDRILVPHHNKDPDSIQEVNLRQVIPRETRLLECIKAGLVLHLLCVTTLIAPSL